MAIHKWSRPSANVCATTQSDRTSAMNSLLRFSAPRTVDIIDAPHQEIQPGQVRVRTLYSGISAGTELTAYRGTNPYLTSEWDPELRLFRGATEHGQLAYPLDGWGYSEVGEVIEIAADPAAGPPDAPRLGDRVWGIWGHRAEGILTIETLRGHVLPPHLDPLAAAFVRVGAIALNGVLAADLGVGSTVAIFGQGVIGLLATRFAVLNGATVIAVDGIPARPSAPAPHAPPHPLLPSPAPAPPNPRRQAGRGRRRRDRTERQLPRPSGGSARRRCRRHRHRIRVLPGRGDATATRGGISSQPGAGARLTDRVCAQPAPSPMGRAPTPAHGGRRTGRPPTRRNAAGDAPISH